MESRTWLKVDGSLLKKKIYIYEAVELITRKELITDKTRWSCNEENGYIHFL